MFFYYNVKEDRPIKCAKDEFDYLYKTDNKIISIKQINEHVKEQAVQKFRIENRKGKILFFLIKRMVLLFSQNIKVL